MKCPRCQAENPTGMKFCGQCATPLVSLCPSCGVANPPGHKFCGQCAKPLTTAAEPRFGAPESYTPKHLAEKILTSRSALEGERKQVTVLFADVKGSMELLVDRDPEEARKLLDPVLERMMEAVHRYEGTVNQVMGDGIMALFGAPVAHEDHAVRACYAALRMLESVSRYGDEIQRSHGVPVQIRVGLNSGEVVVRSIGSDLHMDYTAVGQTTHLAARMEQMAKPGSVLATADTLRLAEGFVQVTSLGAVPIKGLAEPVEVFELVGAGPTRTRWQAAAARGLTRFVGRQQEMEALGQALTRAGAGHGQIVAPVGEPGVGKSRLFWEFTRSHRTHGWLVYETGAAPYGKSTPYFPLINLLRTYFEIEPRDDARKIHAKVLGKLLTLDRAFEPAVPAFLALLDVPVEEPQWQALDPPQRRQRTQEALKRLLLRESQVQPLLLVVEDLHWIDTETQAILDSLVESLPTARILLLFNYRPEYTHTWGNKTYYTQLRIDPLPAENAAELLQALLGSDPGLDPLKQLLIQRTEGNPFFLEESVRTLIETNTLVGERGAYRLTKDLPRVQVPATVQAVLAARIDRLPPEEKHLLQSASVIGRDVPFGLLQAIADLPEEALRRGLADLRAAEFLYEKNLFPELEYTFKHALTHEVAYQSLLQERRKAVHTRVVEAIERLYGDRLAEQAETLAHHALRGEVWERAVDYLRVAGAKVYAKGAPLESAAHYEQALQVLPRLPTNPDNLRRAIDVRGDLHLPLFALGQVPRLTQLHQEAEQLARRLGDQPRLGRISARLAAYSFMRAQYPQGIEYAQEALRVATAMDNPDLRIVASVGKAWNHAHFGEYRPAIELFLRVVEGPDAEHARRLPAGYTFAYLTGCSWLAYCLAFVGDFEQAQMHGDHGIQEAEALEHPQAQAYASFWRAIPPCVKGDFAEALPWGERAVRLCETKGLAGWLPIACGGLGWALAESGRRADGLAYLEQAITLHERMGDRAFLSWFHVLWAEGLLRGGQIERAKSAGDRGLELAQAHGERGYETWARYVLGEIAAAADSPDLEAAFISYERAKTRAGELGMRPLQAHCHLGLGKLYRRTGKREQAQEHLTKAVTMYREMDMRFWLEQAGVEMGGLA